VEYSEKYNYDFQFYFILFMKHIGSVILLAGIYFNLKNIELNEHILLVSAFIINIVLHIPSLYYI
jgi:hypothetical protein